MFYFFSFSSPSWYSFTKIACFLSLSISIIQTYFKSMISDESKYKFEQIIKSILLACFYDGYSFYKMP